MAAHYERICHQLIDSRRTRAREDGRPARGISEEVVAREGAQRWRRELETA
jgi:hypothetical protein